MGLMDDLLDDFDLRPVGPTLPPEPLDLGAGADPAQAAGDAPPPEPAAAPAMPVKPAKPMGRQSADDEKLLSAIGELQSMLDEIQALKTRATTIDDWKAVMLHVALAKPRISELRAMAKAMYVRHFGTAFGQRYGGGGRGSGSNAKVAEAQARSESSLSFEVAERFDKTWHDLQDLLWTIKSVAEGMEGERDKPHFDANPDHLFSPAPQVGAEA